MKYLAVAVLLLCLYCTLTYASTEVQEDQDEDVSTQWFRFFNKCRRRKLFCRRIRIACRPGTVIRPGGKCSCAKCVPIKPSGVCSLPKVTGPCKALLRRYFFDKRSGHCKHFIYGGCKGNGNNFKTLLQCKRMCGFRRG